MSLKNEQYKFRINNVTIKINSNQDLEILIPNSSNTAKLEKSINKYPLALYTIHITRTHNRSNQQSTYDFFSKIGYFGFKKPQK